MDAITPVYTFSMRLILGVDEAGRGPLAGPVAVGVVSAPEGLDISEEFPGVADSKKLREKRREEIFERLLSHPTVRYTVELEDAKTIDREGIATAVRLALYRGVNILAPDSAVVKVLLDGSLKAPPEYKQETVIGGDATVPIISLASIAAKVTRDRLMCALAEQYPEYAFEQHKGYGTKKHYEALRKHGLCAIHRQSFIHLT